MNIVRFKLENKAVIGVWQDEQVYELTSLDRQVFADLLSVVQAAKEKGVSPTQLIEESNYQERAQGYAYASLELLTPIEAPEVWAAGVTYEKSRSARNHETKDKDSTGLTVYDKVYDAERPEIFMKSTAARTVAPHDYVCIRSDSEWQIPEPEVGLVITAEGEIIGFTAGNDMSCRDIEGENPLYLPQAKVWRRSCAFGPSIRLAESVEEPYNLEIACRIYRNDQLVSEGYANTSQLKRKFDELVGFLIRDNQIFDGTVLLTGTCIVPADEFTLQPNDLVEIEVSGVGVLRNEVKAASYGLAGK